MGRELEGAAPIKDPGTYGKSYAPGLETVSVHDSEDYSEEDDELLIDKIIRNKNEEEDKSVGNIDIEGMGKSESVDNLASENPMNTGSKYVHEGSPCSPIVPMNGGMDAVICGVSENEKEHFVVDTIQSSATGPFVNEKDL
jgi:hypothetical protein